VKPKGLVRVGNFNRVFPLRIDSKFRYRNRVVNSIQLTELAQRYARAWCSHVPEDVARFYADDGSLAVNDDPPAVGRSAITQVAHDFMSAFPDLTVTMDQMVSTPEGVRFHWTLAGTNNGPGGTGNRVRISGYELWQLDCDGLISQSKGHFDSADYERQLKCGNAN
jgi:predicted ester cyclase